MTRAERLARDGVVGEPVLFYRPDDPWGVFSNFSNHPIVLPSPWTLEPVVYKWSEVRFQALKATSQEDHDHVVASDSAYESKMRGRAIKLRDDWGDTRNAFCWYVMLEAIVAKATQHQEMFDALIATGNRWIYEDSQKDDIWGWRYHADHRGKNLLGEAVMQTRFFVHKLVF